MSFSDFESADFLMSQPLHSAVQSRWERKAAAQQTPTRANLSTASAKTPRTVTASGKKVRTPSHSDRFIPSRSELSASDSGLPQMQLDSENVQPAGEADHYKSSLAQSLFHGDDLNAKILAFKKKAPKPSEGFLTNLRVVYSQNRVTSGVEKKTRHINSAPERILDAPGMSDDYYLNLLDWSKSEIPGDQGTLAVALGGVVYLWDAGKGSITQLCELANQDDAITSVRWMGDGSHVAVGTSTHEVQMWNVENQKMVRCMKGHSARVSSLSWNGPILSSGGRDSLILNHDVRIKEHVIDQLRYHQQEVCGLSWSPDGGQLASGSNDNMCLVWDARGGSFSAPASMAAQPLHVFSESCAAIKALAWSPHERGLLATGAGTADRHIRFYNTLKPSAASIVASAEPEAHSSYLVNSIDTSSQVCSLVWSTTCKELLSSHGYSQNQLCVWKYPTLVKVAELSGHTSRVLHTAISPDGTMVCSGAGDETLRFWRVWEPAAKKKVDSAASSGGALRMHIR